MSFTGIQASKNLAPGVDVAAGVNADFTAQALVVLSYSHDVFPEDAPGALVLIAGPSGIGVKADPIALALLPLKKSTSAVEQFIATQLEALRAGTAVHPAVAQAAQEAASAKA